MINLETSSFVPFIPDINLGKDGKDVPNYVRSINRPLSASEEFTMELEIDGNLLAMLCGVDMAYGKDFSVEYNASPELVQIRRHKKKRINKKWAKRYGYNEVIKRCSMKNCSISLINGIEDSLTVIGREKKWSR